MTIHVHLARTGRQILQNAQDKTISNSLSMLHSAPGVETVAVRLLQSGKDEMRMCVSVFPKASVSGLHSENVANSISETPCFRKKKRGSRMDSGYKHRKRDTF